MLRTRFAPSPTGLLHVGNAFSALKCEAWAKEHQAELILRIEDIDFTRCHHDLTRQLLDDLAWLGIAFDGEVTFQQQRSPLYEHALERLRQLGVIYPCFCTRKAIEGRLNPLLLDGYPKICRELSEGERERKMESYPFAWRLDSFKVAELLGKGLFWTDFEQHQHVVDILMLGDVIIGRKDIRYSYHLSVVVDDAEQKISHVIRGEDLLESTPVHRVLQQLLGYDSPLYFHHPLIQDRAGGKLSKTRRSVTLKSLRDAGMMPEAVRDAISRGATAQLLHP